MAITVALKAGTACLPGFREEKSTREHVAAESWNLFLIAWMLFSLWAQQTTQEGCTNLGAGSSSPLLHICCMLAVKVCCSALCSIFVAQRYSWEHLCAMWAWLCCGIAVVVHYTVGTACGWSNTNLDQAEPGSSMGRAPALEEGSRLRSCCEDFSLAMHLLASSLLVSSQAHRSLLETGAFSTICTPLNSLSWPGEVRPGCKSVVFMSFPFSLTGSQEGRGRSVGRSMGWRTEICGALLAGGRRPAKGSSTEEQSYAEDLGMGEDNDRTRLLHLHCITSHFPPVMWCWGFCFLICFLICWVVFFFTKRALYFQVKHL